MPLLTMLFLQTCPPQPVSIALLSVFIHFMQLVAIHNSAMKKICCQSGDVYFQTLFKIKSSHSLVSIQLNVVSLRPWASNHTNLHDHQCLNRSLSLQ